MAIRSTFNGHTCAISRPRARSSVTPSKVAPALPWVNREAVLQRDAEIRALREAMQHPPANTLSVQKEGVDNLREAIYTRIDGE